MGRVFPKRERHKTGTGSGFEIITESGSIRSMTERGKQQQQHDDRRDGEINDKVADAVAPKLSISDTEPHLLLSLGWKQPERDASYVVVLVVLVESNASHRISDTVTMQMACLRHPADADGSSLKGSSVVVEVLALQYVEFRSIGLTNSQISMIYCSSSRLGSVVTTGPVAATDTIGLAYTKVFEPPATMR